MTTKVPVELSSTPGIVDGSNATAITIDSSENVGIGNTSMSSYDSNARNLVVGSGTGDEGMTIASGSGSGGRIYFADGTSGDAQKADGYIFYNHASQYMAFGTAGGNERMRILSGGGLTFNGDTAAANALDDYEEGTWTPTVSSDASPGGYSIQSGFYTKIGRVVHLQCTVQISSIGSFSGATVNLAGFPFNIGALDYDVHGNVTIQDCANDSYPNPHLRLINNNTYARVERGNGLSVADNNVNANQWDTGTLLRAQITYMTNA